MQASRNIRSVAGFVRGLWDWTFLNDCFGRTRIRVSDIDGVVERNGHFLWIEVKPERYAGYDVPTGQRLTHEALHRNGAFTILTVWGFSANDVAAEYLNLTDSTAMVCALGDPVPTYVRVWLETEPKPYECSTDRASFKAIVRDWFEWADKQPRR